MKTIWICSADEAPIGPSIKAYTFDAAMAKEMQAKGFKMVQYRAEQKRIRGKYLSEYEIRTGSDGRHGIYLREYNLRVAVFSSNSASVRKALSKVFGDK